MTTYARLDPLTMLVRDLVVLTTQQYESLNGNPKQAFVRRLVVDAQPTPSSTQFVAQGPYVVESTQVRQTWALQSKSAEQIAAEAAAAESAASQNQIRQVLIALRDGVGTSAERMARVEAVLFWVAKEMVG